MEFNTSPAFPCVRAHTLLRAVSFLHRRSKWPRCFLVQKAR